MRRNWAYKCLSSTHFSIIINGSLKGFFIASRGLREGDLLSPFLFTLAVDSLSQIILRAESKYLLKGFQVGFEKINVSHLQYADDILILMDGDPTSKRLAKLLIQDFELVSRLKVNWSKSHLLGISLATAECTSFANSMECSHKEWPTEYLRFPLGGPP